MKYADMDENNKILGWYDTDINFKMEDKSKSFILDNKDLTDTEIIDNLKKIEEYKSLSNPADTQIDRENSVINVNYKEKVLLIPENAIKVSEEDYDYAISKNANYYNQESSTFEVKDFRTPEEIKKDDEAKAKLQKQKELSELVIDHNTVLYNAHGEALGNMATVIAIANATYNRAISIGINGTIRDLVDAYNYIYKNQTVTWKGADNKPHTVQLESLVEASQKAMTAKAEILFKY